jgi:O-antigen/teichoic acid export membrane protein
LSNLYKNVALLASSSVLTVLVGLVTSKTWALIGGPSALAELGLLVALLGICSLVASVGLGSGLVKFGAAALAEGDLERVDALRHGAWSLQFIFWFICAFVLFLVRTLVARWSLGSEQAGFKVVVIVVALWFALATALHTSTLNAFHRVPELARSNVMVVFISSLIGIVILGWFGLAGVVWGVLAGSISSWLVVRTFVLRVVGPTMVYKKNQVFLAAMSLVHFGIPVMLSLLAGQFVQFALPSLILHELGYDEVGYYRVASTISVSYLGFLTNAMGQDYFPRLSALQNDSEVQDVMNRQHQLIMTICLPVILCVLWLAPILVPLITSPAFLPSVRVLEWQLAGDVLKLSSWVMAYVVLARAGSGWFLLTEILAGLVNFVTNFYLMHFFGLPGLGIAYVITYGVYWGIIAVVVSQRFGFGLSVQNRIWVWVGFGSTIVMATLMYFAEMRLRIWAGGGLVLSGVLVSLFFVRSNYPSKFKWTSH